MSASSMDELVSLCKRRGFVFPGSQLYGGLQGTYDYGPLGVELKNNLKKAWWEANVYLRDDIEGLDASILSHPATFKYSGHEETFSDPMIDCRSCKSRWRADFVSNNCCPKCTSTDLTEPRPFNLMFQTRYGPVADANSFAYLRPETAQGIFLNFNNVVSATSRKLPFGIAQIGKAFRNEITPRNFIFRVREFEQMEIEFFVQPGTDEAWHERWVEQRLTWWANQGLGVDNLVVYQQKADELAHYAKATVDILYRFPHGLEELEGVANRTDFDLGSHSRDQESLGIVAKVKQNDASVERISMTDESGNKFVPFVIEPSAGVDRGVLAILNEAFQRETLPDGGERIVLRFKPHLAPVKVAIVPLAKNNINIMDKATKLKRMLQAAALGKIGIETSGNVGKAYRRNDEIGTPFCVTIDFETIGMGDNLALVDTVTIRDRDTMLQQRLPILELVDFLKERVLFRAQNSYFEK